MAAPSSRARSIYADIICLHFPHTTYATYAKSSKHCAQRQHNLRAGIVAIPADGSLSDQHISFRFAFTIQILRRSSFGQVKHFVSPRSVVTDCVYYNAYKYATGHRSTANVCRRCSCDL